MVDSNCIVVLVCFCMCFFVFRFPCIDECDVVSESEKYNVSLNEYFLFFESFNL